MAIREIQSTWFYASLLVYRTIGLKKSCCDPEDRVKIEKVKIIPPWSNPSFLIEIEGLNSSTTQFGSSKWMLRDA